MVSRKSQNDAFKFKRDWEETKEHHGNTVEEIKTEFQTIGLKSLRTTYIKKDKVNVGDKSLFECKKEGCTFAARIILYRKPNSRPKVEVSGKVLIQRLFHRLRRT